ncbi:MAG: hypothetical protein CMH49_07255 [Myxococcales bacterium]|nr:hypothetical protein [Myxococcales bacterium]
MRYWLLFSLIFSLGAFGCEESSGGSGTGLIGESCVNSGDCASGPCVDPGSGALICTQVCDSANPCPSGYSCAATGSSSVCVPEMMSTGGMDMPTGGMEVPVGGTEVSGGMDMPTGGMDMPTGGMDMPTGGMDVPGGGNLSCADLNTCFGMCDPNDQTCVQGCFDSATANAQQQYGAIVTCAQNSGCPENDNACVNEVCVNEIQACLGGGTAPPVGSLSCGGVFLCAGSCAENDAACQNACVQAVAADQAGLLEAYLGCAETNMCQDQTCIETNCAAEVAACFPPGDQTCGQVLDCIGMCQDQSCAGECQLRGNEEATTELQALGECLNTNACMSFDCPQCSAEYMSCTN